MSFSYKHDQSILTYMYKTFLFLTDTAYLQNLRDNENQTYNCQEDHHTNYFHREPVPFIKRIVDSTTCFTICNMTCIAFYAPISTSSTGYFLRNDT